MRDAIILLSGGVDSTTLLWEYASRIALAVSFDYGSKHNKREIAAAAWHCEKLAIPHLVIPLAFMAEHFKSDLLLSGGAVPTGAYNQENMSSTVVPFRNGIMLAIVAGLAESKGLRAVLIANHGGDHFIYPDCRPEFVDTMNQAIKAGTGGQVELLSPYTHLSKTEILQHGAALGVDYAHTYSCYQGGEKHCGVCGTCQERRDSFAEARLEDPTSYEI